MLKLKAWIGIGAIVGVAGVFGFVAALESISPWLKTDAPTIQKLNDLTDNTLPPSSNSDCENISSQNVDSGLYHTECVVNTPLGLASDSGVTFAGTSQSVLVVPPSPFSGLYPVANQEMFFTYTSGPVVGMYMHFYKTIRDKMKSNPDNINGSLQYILTKGPDVTLRTPAGASIVMNPSALAFSRNGNWMVADFPNQGLIRVNMATFEMQPVTASMNPPGDYSGYQAQLAISNNGQYVAIRPRDLTNFSVYDLTTCTGTTLPVDASAAPRCNFRNYWPAVTSNVGNLRNFYTPRFTSDNQLTFVAIHDFISSSNYKVSQYSITAPGENPSGIGYLGMGDSFASGQGAFGYLPDTDTTNSGCHLSTRSYPMMISAALFDSGHSVACSGAVMEDVNSSSLGYKGQVNDGITLGDRKNISVILSNFSSGYIPQKEFVDKYNPQALTLSIGGNDILFAEIVQQCIGMMTCYPTAEDQQELSNRIISIGPNLQQTYSQLKSPGRRVFIIGYPQIVASGGNCADNVRLNDQEVKMFIDLTALLNQTIKNAAAAAGVQYVDVADALFGHRLCETVSSGVAVNGVTAGTDLGIGMIKVIGAETYHPNAYGHQLLMQTILSRTNNLKNSNPGPTQIITKQASPFPYSSAPKTGRPVNRLIGDQSLLPNYLTPGKAMPLTVSPSVSLLKASAGYTAKLEDGTQIGSATTDSLGNLTGSITLPPTIVCGYHTVHLYGPNMLNQLSDIYKTVYIGSASTDCDNNGQPDTIQPCGLLPSTGNDIDLDGIDDGCDPVIGDPPIGPLQKVYLLQSSIHIMSQ